MLSCPLPVPAKASHRAHITHSLPVLQAAPGRKTQTGFRKQKYYLDVPHCCYTSLQGQASTVQPTDINFAPAVPLLQENNVALISFARV